jgi:hypothetical protein
LGEVIAAPGSASRNGRKEWSWGMKLGMIVACGRAEGADLPQTKAKVVEQGVEG